MSPTPTQLVDIGKEVNGFFGYTCVGPLISNIVAFAFIIAGIAFFVLLVMGGLEWLTSGGDKTKIQQAQQRISNALIGFAIVAASFAIYTIALQFFGLDHSLLCSENPVGDGTPKTQICTPGETKCSGNNSRTCNAAGTGWNSRACVLPQTCNSATGKCANTQL